MHRVKRIHTDETKKEIRINLPKKIHGVGEQFIDDIVESCGKNRNIIDLMKMFHEGLVSEPDICHYNK